MSQRHLSGFQSRIFRRALSKTRRVLGRTVRAAGAGLCFSQAQALSAGQTRKTDGSAVRSACRKGPAAPAFVARTRFPCAWGAAGETCREALLRKASEPAAHVAGFGWQLEGFGPPSLPKGVFRQAGAAASRFRYHVPPVRFAHRNMMSPFAARRLRLPCSEIPSPFQASTRWRMRVPTRAAHAFPPRMSDSSRICTLPFSS